MPRNCVCMKHGGGPDDNRLDALPSDLRKEIDRYLPMTDLIARRLPRDLQRMIQEYTGQSAQMTREKYMKLLTQLHRHLSKTGQSPQAFPVGNPPRWDPERTVVPSKMKESVDWENGKPPQWYVEQKARDDAVMDEWRHTRPPPAAGPAFSFDDPAPPAPAFGFGGKIRRNCVCGGKTPHFNTGPNPTYTGLHRKKRTTMDKWLRRDPHVHAVVDLTAESDEKTPSPKRRRKGGVMRPYNETGLRGQPRYNPAVMELYRVIEQLREREANTTSSKERQELQRQIAMLERNMEQMHDQERARNLEGGGWDDMEAMQITNPSHLHLAKYSIGPEEGAKRRRVNHGPANKNHEAFRKGYTFWRPGKASIKQGGGWEDALAAAVERDRVAQIDAAEAKRLRDDAERAKRASLSKAGVGRKRKGSATPPRKGWSDGGTYCR